MLRNYISLLLLAAISLSSCRKKDLPVTTPDVVKNEKGSVGFQLNNVVGDKALVLNSADWYTLPNGDQFSVSLYNYYVTNIILIDDAGNRFAEPESYHLAQASVPQSLTFTIANVPVGNYKAIEFLIGVDSVHNYSGAQSGDLDPKYGMIWSWKTGYIMAKMEGTSPQAKGNKLSYHIAGYTEPNNVVKKVVLQLPQPAVVSNTKTPHIHLQSDLYTWFGGFGFKGFAFTPSIGSEGPDANRMADSYSGMFSITGVEN